MKKIINNKVYDTETAVKVGSWDNGEYGDIHYICETLYRKKTGEFFIHGEGGAATNYAVATEYDHFKAGECIMPMTYQAAQEWAEAHLTADEYQSAFTVDKDDVGKQLISLYVTAVTAAKLKQLASKRGVSQGAVVEQLVSAAE